MDKLKGEDVIANLEPAPQIANSEFKPELNTEYIDHHSLILVKNAINFHLTTIGHYLRRWMTEYNMTESEKRTIDLILLERKI